MKAIGKPDSFFVSAAQGWLELGNGDEARAELDRVSPALQNHPRVLQLRWTICAGAEDWSAAVEIARALMRVAPDHPEAWLHQAYALRRAPGGGLDAAWEALSPALDKFPAEETIPYNLACYACQLGKPDDARALLRRAVAAAGDRDSVKLLALRDPDLESLWPEIREW
jgi:Flp pilus assembly protein TadD